MKKKFTVKNLILKTITFLVVIEMLYFGCCLDVDSNIPAICVAVGFIWLFPFCIANNWFCRG